MDRAVSQPAGQTVGLWNKTADRSWTIFQDYEAQRRTWARDAAENEDFFMGRQWTAQEIRQLSLRGMAPLVVNRTHPMIMQEVAIVCAKRPAFRYFGRDDGDTDVAAMWSDMAAWVWDASNGDMNYQQSVQDMFVTGAGYLQCYIDAYDDDGNGEVRFRSVPPWDVYPDPNSRELDLSDARAIIVSRVVDKDQLRSMYPDKDSQILKATPEHGAVTDRPQVNPYAQGTGMNSSDYDYMGTQMQREKTRVIELYEKVKVPFWKLINPANGSAEVFPKEGVSRDHFPAVAEVMTVWRDRIKLTVTAGRSVVLFEGMAPTSHYPVVPLFLHHARSPYPTGDVELVKGMQREVNKRRSLSIHNATLSGNYRMLAEEGQITNEEDFKTKGTVPGFILKYRPTSTGQAPRELLPQQLPAAWYQLESEAKQDMEYTLSIFGSMMGNAADAPETFRGLLAMEETGQQKIRHKSGHARNALVMLGKVMFDYMRYVYTEMKLIRVTGEDNEDYKEIMLNGTTVDPETGIPRMVNDTQVGEYDLVVVDGSSMPTNRQALLSAYMELYQLGIIDREEVLKKTDVVNKSSVLERMSEIAQLSGQLEQAAETIKNLEGLNQTMRRQLQQSEVNQDVLQAGQTIEGELQKTKMTEELTRLRLQDELGLLRKRSELEMKEAAMTAGAFSTKTKMEALQMKMKAEMEAQEIRQKARSQKPKQEA